jgi:hypothetical protein
MNPGQARYAVRVNQRLRSVEAAKSCRPDGNSQIAFIAVKITDAEIITGHCQRGVLSNFGIRSTVCAGPQVLPL